MTISMRTIFQGALAAIAVSMSLVSQPVAAADIGPYMGADFGRTPNSYRRADFDAALAATFNETTAVESTSVRKNDLVWSVSAGYQASPHFGLEVSYLNLGTVRYRAVGTRTLPSETQALSVDIDVRSRGPALSLLWAWPVSRTWALDVRAGAYSAKTSTKLTLAIDSNATSDRDSTSSASLLLGFGGRYAVSEHLAVRLDYLHVHQVDEKVLEKPFNVDVVTAGLTYAF
jgi:opacity protein-like surface antigen